MKIQTLWGWRKGEDGPELLVAWDEVTVDNWAEGFKEACDKAVKELGDDLSALGVRLIDINVYYDDVMAAFWPRELQGEVEGA